MSPEFLFFADLVLLLRLRWLLGNADPGARGWIRKCAIEIAVLTAFLPAEAGWIGAVVTSVLVNGAALGWERRGRNRGAGHLVLGAVHLVALSVCLGPAAGAVFRPWLAAAAQAIAEGSALGAWLLGMVRPAGLKVFFGLLVAANEANLLIRWVLGRLQLRPGGAAAEGIDPDEYARGRVIGMLERSLIYFFVLNGQFGAVGFTLAAKGFTRFRELENRGFAEYVLIGTLLSSGIAMLVATAIRWM